MNVMALQHGSLHFKMFRFYLMEKRKILDLQKYKLYSLFFDDADERSTIIYIERIEEFETQCEAKLLDILKNLDFNSTVKQNRYSLPYTHEIIHTIQGSSDLNEVFNFHRVARVVIRKLLQENVYKIRFYMYINIVESQRNTITILDNAEGDREKYEIHFGNMEYRFRYYVH